jgi:putative SOS response-associated peptidase YedK
MCGRFVLASPLDELAEEYRAVATPLALSTYQPSFNVAPTHQVLGVRRDGDGGRQLDCFRWGLVPPGARDPSVGSRLFNARAESVDVRPAFRSAFSTQRLAVIADGFYEWKHEVGRSRQPFYIHRGDGKPLAFAGLWEVWADAGTATWLRSCTIITTSASADVAGLHDRMPVILEPSSLERWLGGSLSDDDGLRRLLRPLPTGRLVSHPVSAVVGDVRNDDPSLIEPVDVRAEPALAVQPTLFDPDGGPTPV